MEPTRAPEARRDTLSVAAVVLAVLALIGMTIAVGIAASDDDGGGGGDATQAVAATASSANVSLTEFKIDPKIVEVASGGTLNVTNDGTVQHNLSVEGESVATKMLDGGASESLSIGDLAEGTYKILCTVSGHAEAGMTGELHVGAGGSSGQAGQAAAHSQSEMTAEEMDAAARERTLAFPAETEGEGAQELTARIGADGAKEFDLTADVVQWEVEPGKVVEAWAYNGQVPGPTLRVGVGDKVRVKITNNLKESTTIHFHGVDIPNEMDGVPDVTQEQIKMGESFTYEFTTTEPAVGMYHAHSNSQVQVPMGLAGAFLVGEMPRPAGVTPTQPEQMFILNDAGNIGFAINGKSFPATKPYTAKVGESFVAHYFNEGFQIHPMHLHGPTQLVIAKDGHPVPQPYVVDTLNIAPGERYTVVVTPNRPGTWVWHCHILTHAESPSGFIGMTTALVVS